MAVLHSADWSVPDPQGRLPVVHTETKNSSFRSMVLKLDRMGIKNNLFYLALYNQSLRNVDPHDPNLTYEQKLAVAYECRHNIWYFIREVVRLPATGGSSLPFELNRANLAMLWCFFSNISITATQPRQTGKAQPLYAKIKTPDGWAYMGDIRVGDEVTAPDGSVTAVTGVYPQGVKPVYRITFEDGRAADCCDEHLWKVFYQGAWRVMQLCDIRDLLTSADNAVYIPLMEKRMSESQLCAELSTILGRDCALDENGDFRCTTVSADIANQVVQLVREAGGICQLTTSNEVRIRYGTDRLQLLSVTYIGDTECRCISVDHQDHLYITDNFIVTHNTFCAIIICCYVIYVYGYNVTIGMFTHSDDLVQGNVGRLKSFRDQLPPYLIMRSVKDTDNKEEVSYYRLRNTYKTYIGQKDARAATRVARGEKIAVFHIDESGYVPNIKISFKAMMPTTDAAVREAKAAGQPHSNIFTTTAADPSTPEGEFAYSLVTGAFAFTERLYDTIDNAAAWQLIKANSTNHIVNATFSYLQIGRTHEWFNDQVRRVTAGGGADDEDIERDYLNIWKTGGQLSIIPKHLISAMNTNRVEPSYLQMHNDYVLNWYLPQSQVESATFRNRPMILGLDSSEQIGRDFTAAVLIDPVDLRVLGTFRCNESNLLTLGLFLGQFLVDHPRVLFVPERKSSAGAIIDIIVPMLLKANHNPFLRIYNRVVDDRDNPEYRDINIHDRELCRNSRTRAYLGFMTTGRMRDLLYKRTLQKAVALGAERIYDSVLITELCGLSTVNGRIDHRSGRHDDMVIAYLLACYALFDGKNLAHYGIPLEAIMNAVASNGTRVDPTHMMRQIALRKEVAQLQALYDASEPHSQMRSIHGVRLRQLAAQIDNQLQLEPVATEQFRQAAPGVADLYTPSTHILGITPPPSLSAMRCSAIDFLNGTSHR